MTSISGIYEIVNKVNGHRYIGQSIDIQKRWQAHKRGLRSGKHYNSYFQNAWNKYGEDNFEFNIIVRCFPFRIVLDTMEQHYIDTLHPEYNLSPTAGGSCAGVVRSQETKDKLRDSRLGRKLSDETKAKISVINKGRKMTPEQYERHLVAQRSYKHLGFIGGKHTQEAKDKISKASQTISDETRQKLSVARKGKTLSQETKDKLKASKSIISQETRDKLRVAGTGQRWSQERRDRASLARKGKKKSESFKKQVSLTMTGRKHSESHKAKLSVANKGKPKSPEHIQRMKEGWAKKRTPL